jgi:hypothetical protein
LGLDHSGVRGGIRAVYIPPEEMNVLLWQMVGKYEPT